MTQQADLDMRAVEFRADGTPTKYEVVHSPQPYIIGADDAPIVAPMPAQITRASSVVEGSWKDRAEGFNLSTRNLSLVVGGMFLVAAWVFGSSLSLWTLAAAYFAGFSLTWLVAFLLHTFVSAEGSQFLETVFLWRFLFNEQHHRHSRYDVPQRSAPAWLGPVLLAGAVGFIGLFVLLVVAAVAVELMPR